MSESELDSFLQTLIVDIVTQVKICSVSNSSCFLSQFFISTYVIQADCLSYFSFSFFLSGIKKFVLQFLFFIDHKQPDNVLFTTYCLHPCKQCNSPLNISSISLGTCQILLFLLLQLFFFIFLISNPVITNTQFHANHMPQYYVMRFTISCHSNKMLFWCAATTRLVFSLVGKGREVQSNWVIVAH